MVTAAKRFIGILSSARQVTAGGALAPRRPRTPYPGSLYTG